MEEYTTQFSEEEHLEAKKLANEFLNIEPDWDNVNNIIFLGHPKGKLLGCDYITANQMGADAVTQEELDYVVLVLDLATEVYETKKLFDV